MRGTSGIARLAGVGLLGSMIMSACVAPAGALDQRKDDRSMDQVERTRSMIGLGVETDTSYDHVERTRLLISAATPDTSYDQVEQARGGAFDH